LEKLGLVIIAWLLAVIAWRRNVAFSISATRNFWPILVWALAFGGACLIAFANPPELSAAAQGDSPTQLRRFIDQQVGGIDKLKVPATDADIPLPRRPDGTVNPRYQTTEQKRYLGKLLFHDPIRTARIDPAYGGVLATKQTASCGSCHLGEAAGKAGAQFNFAVGGEGRGYTDEKGISSYADGPGPTFFHNCGTPHSFRATRWWMHSLL
jgi:hypothetical protein